MSIIPNGNYFAVFIIPCVFFHSMQFVVFYTCFDVLMYFTEHMNLYVLLLNTLISCRNFFYNNFA